MKKRILAFAAAAVMLVPIFNINLSYAAEYNILNRDTEIKVYDFNYDTADTETLIPVDKAHFEDAEFRTYLTSEFPIENGKIDAIKVTKINCSDKNIKSLKGIEYFTELKELDCNLNNISDVDISKNIKLVSLSLFENKLTKLDVSKNTELTSLTIFGNRLTAIDVSKNTKLESLRCQSNKIKNLDVSNNKALTELVCFDNQMACFDCTGTNISRCNFANQNIDLEFAKGKLDMSSYSGFDARNIISKIGCDFVGNTLVLDEDGYLGVAVKYEYDCGNGNIMDVVVNNTGKTYSITYVLNGGINSENNIAKEYKAGTKIPLYDAERNGYIFAGWFTDSAYKTQITEITPQMTGNIVCYAKWVKQVKTPEIQKITNEISGIKLSWKKVAGAEKYAIMRYDSSLKQWQTIATPSATSISYIDKNVKSGKNYKYIIKCISSDGKINASDDSDIASKKFVATPKVKSAKNNSAGKVIVKWTKSSGAKKYAIYRKVKGGKWKKIATTSKTSYTDKNVKKGKTYTYAIQSVDTKGRIVSGIDKKHGKKVVVKK